MDRWPVAAVVTAILVRALIAAAAWQTGGTEAFLAPDSRSYLEPASALASRLAFENAAGHAEVFRTPGYPLTLAAGMIIGHPILFAIVLQCILSVALVLMVFHGTRHVVADQRVASVAALVMAIEPVTLFWSLKVMPETLLTLCVLAFAIASWRALESGRPGWTAAAAALACAAAYVKPIAWPLVPAVCAAAFLPWPGGRTAALRRGAIVTLTAASLLAPWHIRNARVADYRGFSTLTDHALYISAGGSILARQNNQAYAEVRRGMYERAAGPGGVPYRTMRREGWALLRSDPFGYGRTHVEGMARTLFDPGAVEYLRLFGWYPESGGALARAVDVGLLRGSLELARSRPLAFATTALFAFPLAALVILPVHAAFRLTSRVRMPFVVLAVVAAYLAAAGGGVPGSSRFRVPMVPLLVIMSGLALSRSGRVATLDQ